MANLIKIFVVVMMSTVLCMEVTGQELTGEKRAQFIAEQDAYLESLQLSIDQRKAYQLITIKYEKVLQSIARSDASDKVIKSNTKKALKEKDIEMKAVLSPAQFKRYLKRQKEIAEYYE